MALRARRFSRLVTRRYEHALRDTGLTPTQFTLLGAVALKGPVAPVALARMLDLEKSTLSRNLRPLLRSRFLISEGRKAGGQLLTITARGRRRFHEAVPAWRSAQTEVVSLVGRDAAPKLDRMIASLGKT